MRPLRSCLCALMALLLLLTGQAVAHARGAPAPGGRIELCTGTAMVMVWVDEDGQPTGPPVLCPKMAPLLLLALSVEAPQAVVPERRAVLLPAVPLRQGRALSAPGGTARDPPPSA